MSFPLFKKRESSECGFFPGHRKSLGNLQDGDAVAMALLPGIRALSGGCYNGCLLFYGTAHQPPPQPSPTPPSLHTHTRFQLKNRKNVWL